MLKPEKTIAPTTSNNSKKRPGGGGGGGVGKPEGGHRGKSQLERGGFNVKFNTQRRGELLFSLFFTNWKSGKGAIRVQIFILFLFYIYTCLHWN